MCRFHQPTDEYEPDEPANATKSNPDSPDSPSEAPSLSSIIAVPPTDASTENMNIFDNLLRATSTDSYGIWSVFKIQSTHQPEDYDSDPKDVSFSMSLIDVSGMESEAETEHLSTKGFAETLRQELDDLVKQLNSQNDYYVHVQAIRIGTVTTLVGTVSIGYVAWILRGGVLLAGLLSHMPTWCSFDPLPVLENWDRGQKNRGQHPDNAEEDEDESEQRVKSIL